MIGKRLFKLLQELNTSQSKKLLHYSKVSSDKRLAILIKLIKNRELEHDALYTLLNKEAKLAHPNQNNNELEHTLRRMCDFFCIEIENIIIIDSTENDSKLRARILSDYFTETANPYLSDYYLNKGYTASIKEEDDISALHFGSKLVTLSYSKYTKADFLTGIQLNNGNKELAENFYTDKLVEYYNNISNIYIENYTLINQNTGQLKKEIDSVISDAINARQIIDLRISQMRLSYNAPEYEKYVSEVERLMDQISGDKISHLNLRKKYYYMKLIYGFFTGKNRDELLLIVNEILSINEKTKHTDSIAMWYKIILLIMSLRLDEAKLLLNKSKYFKLDYAYLKEFLNALIGFVEGNNKKSVFVFNNLINSKNYFIGHFSLITLIKIQLDKGNEDVCLSLIQSGLRQIKQHPEKFIINSSTEKLLNHFKEIIEGKFQKMTKGEKSFCLFHQFILNSSLRHAKPNP